MNDTMIRLLTLAPTLACICLSSLQAVRADGIHYDELDQRDLAAHDSLDPSSSHGHTSHWSFRTSAPTASSPTFTVNYFVHNHGGTTLTAGMLSRIADAAAVWNAAGAKVMLSAVGTNAAADIHVHGDITSGCGSGALGCAESGFSGAHTTYGDSHSHHQMATNPNNLSQELTMISSGITWYTGADAGGIGGSQYDYMTVAIQEFGHHLGLEHNVGHGESTSPMNGILFNGTTRRVLQPSDLAAIQHVWGLGAAVPEPSSLTLLAGCLAMFGARRWRRRRARK